MAKLILSKDGDIIKEVHLDQERITIGRSDGNDICLPDRSVSNFHALILNILDDSFVRDLNSTNGTYVNGGLIKKHQLRPDDIIHLGVYELLYKNPNANDNIENDELNDFEETMIISPATLNNKIPKDNTLSEQANQPENAIEKEDNASGPRLRILTGKLAGQELLLTRDFTKLGKSGVQVAGVTRKDNQFYFAQIVQGVENEQPPKVNGKNIGPDGYRLRDNDVIEITGIKMGFLMEQSIDF